ncbi:MAG: hypothetical protein IT458_00150 [Planctomycetes bacterium]|nr:hypothetical protein [Planctomycetota bacterium]
MKTLLPVSVALAALSLPLVAQMGPQYEIRTRTDYGVFSQVGTNVVVDGIPADTVVTRGVQIASRQNGTHARTHATFGVERGVATLMLHEGGNAVSTPQSGPALAGTIDEKDASAAHSLMFRVSGQRLQNGVVRVTFQGHASDGAFARAAVDLDGDGRPEFAAEAPTRTPVVREFRVTPGPRGYAFTVTTHASAGVRDRGQAGYESSLSVSFQERGGGGGGSVTFTPYGRECGARLQGAEGRMGGVVLTLDNAVANSFGLFAIGREQADISLGTCKLLVQPALVIALQTDATGKAVTSLRGPGSGAMTLYAQGIVLDLGQRAFELDASNGLKIERR